MIAAEVVGVPSTKAGAHGGLIGRDFLAHFHLHYHGPDGTFELVYPTNVGPDVQRRERDEKRAKRNAERQRRAQNRNRR